jgi:tRNA(Arg) A34 adenosine deaminase TadA
VLLRPLLSWVVTPSSHLTSHLVATMFAEVIPCPTEKECPKYIMAYIAEVEPERCGRLIKRLASDLPLSPSHHEGSSQADLSHLKRVKSTIIHNTDSTKNVDNEDFANGDMRQLPTKRRRSNGDDRDKTFRLEIVLGTVSTLDKMYQNASDQLMENYALRSVLTFMVPSRHAESEQERKEFQSVWPIVFFANRTAESREREMQLKQNDMVHMTTGMKAAIQDANEQDVTGSARRVGTVIVNPTSGRIVGRSCDERAQQQNCSSILNPLATSVLRAIQCVSRMERQAAMNHGMDSAAFQTGQYLCTGCDVYTTLEPTAFEAMALVHARIRRLVIGCRRNDALGGVTETSVHSLPGTNHKYRAFVCEIEGDLAKACIQLRNDCI